MVLGLGVISSLSSTGLQSCISPEVVYLRNNNSKHNTVPPESAVEWPQSVKALLGDRGLEFLHSTHVESQAQRTSGRAQQVKALVSKPPSLDDLS